MQIETGTKYFGNILEISINCLYLDNDQISYYFFYDRRSHFLSILWHEFFTYLIISNSIKAERLVYFW